jgi:hypothetical protein
MLDRTRPAPADLKRLTRAIVKGGEYFRIVSLYGVTPIGSRILNAYQLAVGCRSDILDAELARDAAAGRDGFYVPESRRCAVTWYSRQRLTPWQRELREVRARRERGEHLWMAERQAS